MSSEPTSSISPIDFVLPEELIAQEPLPNRDESRLLVLHRDTGQIEHSHFKNLLNYLAPGDLLVMNNTVVEARKVMGRVTQKGLPAGPLHEFLLMPKERIDQPMNVQQVMCRNSRKLKLGKVIEFCSADPQNQTRLIAMVIGDGSNGAKLIEFEPVSGDLGQAIESIAYAALPPYIHQLSSDKDRYQTVYAHKEPNPGSAAAPTAGLHFTPELLKKSEEMGIDHAFVNLSVGLDTFRPIKTESAADHEMIGESCTVTQATADKIAACQGRVIAVGTTTTRTLETFARQSAKPSRNLQPGQTVSKLFLYPGQSFYVVNGMITNFHMPRTTMLLMVAALAGTEPLKEAYRQAIAMQYRFLSFGDAMLII